MSKRDVLKYSDNIERIAVTKLKDEINKTGCLLEDIKVSDKFPFWDGPVLIYNGADHSNVNAPDKVWVQVKGKRVTEFKPKMNFQLDIYFLKAYRKDNGIIFFLVCLKSTTEYEIYYKLLLPYDLEIILGNTKGKSTSLVLDKLDKTDEENLLRLFRLFAVNKAKQGVINKSIFQIASLNELGVENESLLAHVVKEDDNKTIDFVALFNFEQYLYIKLKDQDIDLVIGKIMIPFAKIDVEQNICINGKVYYSKYEHFKTKTNEYIVFGNSFKFALNPLGIEYKFEGMLLQSIIDYGFLIDLFKEKKFHVGSQKIDLESIGFSDSDINDFKTRFDVMQKTKILFEMLHLSMQVNINEYSNNDYLTLKNLITSFVDGGTIQLNAPRDAKIIRTSLGKFMLFIELDTSNFIDYTLKDFYSCSLPNIILQEMEVSKFAGQIKEEYLYESNFRSDYILESVKQLYDSENFVNNHIFIALNLLHRFDKYGNIEDLECAESLVDLFLEKDPLPQMYLNKLQITKRKRSLCNDEIEQLTSIMNNQECFLLVKIGAQILLEKFDEAKLLINSLDEETRNEFIEYPIMHMLDTWPIS